MRRTALAIALLAAAALAHPALAQPRDPMCLGRGRLVEQAPGGFGDLPLSLRLIPGSIQERRGFFTPADGTPRKPLYIALMFQDSTPQATANAQAKFRALHAEIARCITAVRPQDMSEPQNGAMAVWTLDQAQVALRGAAGNAGGDSATAVVELTVMQRF